jgi:NADP-dependent alcohol dehydrogenase
MNNFELYNPTRLCFGKNQIEKIAELVPNSANVMVLYGGGSIKNNGTLDEVSNALGERNISYFAGIEPNPSYETMMRAVAQVKENNINFLIAVGGGSVIDGTKFVAAAAKFDGEPWDILLKMGSNVSQALPFGCVLTLPATGSEMNSGSVITKKSENAKLFFGNALVYPKFSILDPTKTYSLPEKQIANGVVDAYIHVIEQYLTYPVNAAVQDRFAEGLLQTLIEQGPKALTDKENYDIRANIMFTATMALNGLIGVGVPQDWSTHMIGHELTALHGIDHAQTLAIILPNILIEKKTQKLAKLVQYAERVWGIAQGSDSAKADAAINKTREFFEQMGIKTHLSDYKLDENDIPTIVKQLEKHGRTQLGEHQDIDIASCTRILQNSL